MNKDINHIAIIMDGNARWAKTNNKTKIEGHKAGAEAAKALLPHIHKTGIKYLTLYAFSSENWLRPKNEVESLIKLLYFYTSNEVAMLSKYNLKLKVVGNLKKLSPSLQKNLKEAVDKTKQNNGPTLCIAFSYGSRMEIIDAVNKIIDSGNKNITESMFSKYLYDPSMPDVDLLIRTSGVSRISNFLLWQSAYAELYFIDKYWPDFDYTDLEKALLEYKKRSRRFGQRNED